MAKHDHRAAVYDKKFVAHKTKDVCTTTVERRVTLLYPCTSKLQTILRTYSAGRIRRVGIKLYILIITKYVRRLSYFKFNRTKAIVRYLLFLTEFFPGFKIAYP